ncbi:Global transcription regulator sge1 [Entomophthora muscae]|uniref:Global transcription regulator sge1 n=1 Tax=Entomophthora muscae TaxID=34485 RepID=A0ACC2S3F6_9FUNG|nr:Global transcription regulator sge1 [Entomophthora muscae]
MLNMEFVSLETSQPQQEGGLLSFETYFGYIESVSDAERVIAAVKAGQLRQTFVRLSQRDQGLIRSGTVIVWEEGLSGIQRWTDGRTWSASRFQDEFLIYQELPLNREVQSPARLTAASASAQSPSKTGKENVTTSQTTTTPRMPKLASSARTTTPALPPSAPCNQTCFQSPPPSSGSGQSIPTA